MALSYLDPIPLGSPEWASGSGNTQMPLIGLGYAFGIVVGVEAA